MRLRSLKLSSEGQSLIELAIALPLLVMLGLFVFEFSRALYAENTIVNMGREGANLFSRTNNDPHDIITILRATAPASLHMDGTNSIIYITKVSGKADGSGNVEIVEQHRPHPLGAYTPASRLPTTTSGRGSCVTTVCSPWVNDTCTPPANSRPLACLNNLNLAVNSLPAGSNAFVVEVFFRHDTIFNNIGIGIKPDMYSIAIF
jgi:Flp pilus assembly protein TadG